MDLISVNGKFNQTISVNDRGLLFGESVYEVIPTYHKKPFQLNRHLDRLEHGFKFFSNTPLPMGDIRKWIFNYLKRMPYLACDNIYIQVTTGAMGVRDHKPDNTIKPTVIIHRTQMHNMSFQQYMHGFRATCIQDRRSDFSCIKSNHLAHNTMALKYALDHGFDTGIFIKNNCVAEGVASNFFAILDDTLITPPTQGILDGITRQVVLKIAEENNIPYEISLIPLNDLKHMDEIFLTSSTKALHPIVEIDDLFQKESTGPMWLRLYNHYIEAINEECKEEVLPTH